MRRGLLASGSVIVLAIGAIVVLGLAVITIYKAKESGLPPVSASFQRLDSGAGNATVHTLDFKQVHATDPFLEDHLNTALDRGASLESQRLRVEQMRSTLTQLTGDSDDVLVVSWQDHLVRVVFSGIL